MERYSDIYHTARRRYRYNYDRCCLEMIGNRVVTCVVRGYRVSTVEQGVLAVTGLRPDTFDRAPGYWVDLFDSALDREV